MFAVRSNCPGTTPSELAETLWSERLDCALSPAVIRGSAAAYVLVGRAEETQSAFARRHDTTPVSGDGNGERQECGD